MLPQAFRHCLVILFRMMERVVGMSTICRLCFCCWFRIWSATWCAWNGRLRSIFRVGSYQWKWDSIVARLVHCFSPSIDCVRHSESGIAGSRYPTSKISTVIERRLSLGIRGGILIGHSAIKHELVDHSSHIGLPCDREMRGPDSLHLKILNALQRDRPQAFFKPRPNY